MRCLIISDTTTHSKYWYYKYAQLLGGRKHTFAPPLFILGGRRPSSPPRFLRLWTTQMTSPSHLHTQARVQQRNTLNHTYIKCLPGQKKQSHTKSRQNNLHSVYSRPCRIYEQSGPNNKQQSTTHGNCTQRFWVLP